MKQNAQQTARADAGRETRILPPTPENISLCAIELNRGGIVAFPTETVYGLGASAFDETAVRHIFEAKGRPNDNPLIVHVGSIEQIQTVVTVVSERARLLIEHFMPGPLTLIFRKKSVIPDMVTAGLKTVAVRMPADQTALELIRRAGVPIAAPSANRSGAPSPTTARHVYEDMNGKIPYILDGGASAIGVESTVVDVRPVNPRILRLGAVSAADIARVIGGAVDAPSTAAGTDDKPLSPGMKYRHYAPHAAVCTIAFAPELYVRVRSAYDAASALGKNAVILCLNAHREFYGARHTYSAGDTYADYAKNLYAMLRAADADGFDAVIAEGTPDEGIGAAIMNRLDKAGQKDS